MHLRLGFSRCSHIFSIEAGLAFGHVIAYNLKQHRKLANNCLIGGSVLASEKSKLASNTHTVDISELANQWIKVKSGFAKQSCLTSVSL